MKRSNCLLVIYIVLGMLFMGCEQSRKYVNLEDFEDSSGRTWVYQDNSNDSLRQGGFGQITGDKANDGSGLLEIRVDPDDSSNHVLAWTFYGNQPNGITEGGGSYFDLFLLLDEEDWSSYIGIRFDVKTTRNGGSDRDFLRLQARLDQGDGTNLFNEDGEVWRAYKLDVGHDGEKIPDDDHKSLYALNNHDLFPPNGIWPQDEFEAKREGWSTFELDFDKVSDTRSGFYLDTRRYDIGEDWAYDPDIYGENNNPDYDGIIERNLLECLRFTVWLASPMWIGEYETITIYIDNVRLVRCGFF